MQNAEPPPLDEDPPTVLSRETLFKAVSHPIRVDILRALVRGPGSPATIAPLNGCTVGTADYHFKVLDQDCGLLEPVDDVPKARDHQQFFRLRAVRYESLQLDVLPPIAQYGVIAALLEQFVSLACLAIEDGTINRRLPYGLAARPAVFDEEGWERAQETIREADEEIELIASESRIRLKAATMPESIHAVLGLALFDAGANAGS
jgi:DNA-binding transcriptional ArsR family regulator